MNKISALLSLMLISSMGFGAQSPEPKSITCRVLVIDMMNTRVSEVLKEKTIQPHFKTASRDGEEYKTIVKNDKFEIGLTLSYLAETPLLALTVKSGSVTTETELRAVVSTTGSSKSTVVDCTYVPGMFQEANTEEK